MRMGFLLIFAVILLVDERAADTAGACCPVASQGTPVVNADQTVLILWDAATKTQHFIRQASFKSDADDFGFLIPTPTQPRLDESGNEAFAHLSRLTEPETKVVTRYIDPNVKSEAVAKDYVKVLESKRVAGFDAQVLEASSATALVGWLKEHGYAFSPAVEAWAKPYVDKAWKMVALKVAKNKGASDKTVTASALRLSFETDRPVFPYREPDSRSYAEMLGARNRLLRIYFIAEGRYQGELTPETPWTGRVAWSGPVAAAERSKVLAALKLPETTGPAQWWLTEFEDHWAYQVAPADVYFARDSKQTPVQREPNIQYQYVAAPVAQARQAEESSLLLLYPVVAGTGGLAVVGAAVAYFWLRRRV